MSKIFLFFPLLLFSLSPNYWFVDDIVYLPKDYPAIYKIYYEDNVYTLKFRWSLYKNDGLVMLYNFKSHPYQNILYLNSQLNGFKKFLTLKSSVTTPYFMIYFREFTNDIAKFEFLIYNPKMNIKIDLNEPRYRQKKWVLQLKPLYQPQFEREIK